MSSRLGRVGAGIVGTLLMVGAVPMAFADGPKNNDNISVATSPYAPTVTADTWTSVGFDAAALTDGIESPLGLASDGNERLYWASNAVGSADVALTWAKPHVLSRVSIIGWQPAATEQLYVDTVAAPATVTLKYVDVRTGEFQVASANCEGPGTVMCTLSPAVMTSALTVEMNNGTTERHVGVKELSVYAGAIDAARIVVDPLTVAWLEPFTLPSHLDVPLVGGGRAWAPVTWDAEPVSGNPALPGEAVYQGRLDGVADPVSIVVNVADAIAAVSNVSVTTVAGVAPTLPETVEGTLASGGAVDVPVAWEPIAPKAYAEVGTFTVTGSYDDPYAYVPANGTVIRTIVATVVVGNPPGPVPTVSPTISIDVPAGADGLPQLHPGETFRLVGSNLEANTTFEVWMLSTPIQLGATASDGNGTFAQDFRVPSDVEFGKHRIQIRTGGTVVAEAWFDLVDGATGVSGHSATRAKAAVGNANSALSSRHANLSRTGADLVPLAVAAGVFVAAGSIVFIARRRSRSV